MPKWLLALLMGSTALHAPDDGGAGGDDQDEDLDEGLDAGGDDDGDDTPDDDDLSGVDADEGQDEPPARTPSRQQRDVARLRSERQDLARQLEEERQARIRAETIANDRIQREAAEAERRRVEAMEPWERDQHQRDQQLRQANDRMARLEFQTWDTNDRAVFRDKCADVPAYAKIRDEVEQRFQQSVKEGRPADRVTIARYLIGEKAEAQARKQGKNVRRRAEESQQRHQARPGAARSDTRADTRQTTTERAARAKRVENMDL